jgi:hypothetical protein
LSRPHLAHRLVLEHLADSGPAIAEEHEPAPDHLRHAPEGARDPPGINSLAIQYCLAAFADKKSMVDQSSARAPVTDVTSE